MTQPKDFKTHALELETENARLKRIIAKELTENDALGADIRSIE